MNAMTPGKGADLLRVLLGRVGVPTTLCLENGATATTRNCAWGRDVGDDWEHLSLNISPAMRPTKFGLLSARDVVRVIDPASGDVIYRRPAAEAA